MEEKEKIPVGWNSKREANNTQCNSGAVERMMRRRERLFLVDGIVRRTPVPPVSSNTKGLQRQCLIGSAVAGFNHAKTITKASSTDLHTRQDDYNKGI